MSRCLPVATAKGGGAGGRERQGLKLGLDVHCGEREGLGCRVIGVEGVQSNLSEVSPGLCFPMSYVSSTPLARSIVMTGFCI
jgi:hypothetical protein